MYAYVCVCVAVLSCVSLYISLKCFRLLSIPLSTYLSSSTGLFIWKSAHNSLTFRERTES